MTLSKGLRKRKITREYKLAIGYLRTSKEDGDTKKGIDSQRLFIEDYAEQQGYTIVEWKQDDGISGKAPLEDRKGLVETIQLCKEGVADVILTYDVMRIARDIGVFGAIRNLCAKEGIKGFTTNGIEWTSDDEIVGFYALLGEIERKAIAKRLYGGRRVRSKKDGMGSGTLPYGYMRDTNGCIIIDESAAETVRMVLKLRETLSYSKTIAALSAAGISTPDHGTWGNSSIQRIEKNRELYTTGIRRWGTVEATDKWPIIVKEG